MQPSQERNEGTKRPGQQAPSEYDRKPTSAQNHSEKTELNPGKLGNDREIDLNRGQAFQGQNKMPEEQSRSNFQDGYQTQASKQGSQPTQTPSRHQNVDRAGVTGVSGQTAQKDQAGQAGQASRQNDRGAQQDRTSRH